MPNESGLLEGSEFSPHGLFDGVWMPECILGYHGISAQSKILLCRMMKYSGKKSYCWPSIETLASELGVTERTIGFHLKELADDGFISRKRMGLGKSNRYAMRLHRVLLENLSPPDVELDFEDDPEDRNTTSDPDRKKTSDQDQKRSSDPDRKISTSTYKEEVNHSKLINTSIAGISNSFLKTFVTRFQSPKGAPKLKAEDKRQILAWFESLVGESEEDVLMALDEFQTDQHWIEAGLPFSAFKKQFLKYLEVAKNKIATEPGREPLAQHAGTIREMLDRQLGAAGLPETVTITETTDRVMILPQMPEEADIWNAAVPSAPPVMAWNRHSASQKALDRARENPAFHGNLGKLLARCEALNAKSTEKNKGWLTFERMLDKWAEILNGGLKWLTHDFDKPDKSKITETVAEKMLRERREKKP